MSPVTRDIGGRSPRVNTARTPGICRALSVSIVLMRPLAMVAPTGTACSRPGKSRSAA